MIIDRQNVIRTLLMLEGGLMRRVEKELIKKMANYTARLADFGLLERLSMNQERQREIEWRQDLHTLGACYSLYMDYDRLEGLGQIECAFYHDNTFGISKEVVPFYVNDCLSLKQIMGIFWGTPFDLRIEKIRDCEFNRYCLSLTEISVQDFDECINDLFILRSCLFKIHEKVQYD